MTAPFMSFTGGMLVFITAVSMGSPFLKKSSGVTGAVRNISSLKYTNLSDRPGILWRKNSIGRAENVGRYSPGI